MTIKIKKKITELRYFASTLLRKAANRVYPKTLKNAANMSNVIHDIGREHISRSAKRVALIYNIAAIRHLVEGSLDSFLTKMNKHTMYWESLEMVRLLNKNGYIVDYIDVRSTPQVDWNNYDIIIDERDNLKDCVDIPGQKKIFYATGCHWLTWNLAELKRIKMFRERTGILIPMVRQISPCLSDEYADYLTYFGTDKQINTFSPKSKKNQLNISSVFIPEYKEKNINNARNKFLWLGGGGLIHKGLDIVVEAFRKIPNAELYITGNLKDEPRFWEWISPILSQHKNIHAMGWIDVSSPEFANIANQCIGIVYASCAEGGPGSVAQALHFGLIPIVTPSSYVRAEVLGYQIKGESDIEMINSIIEHIQTIMYLSEKELKEKSEAAREFGLKYHTRKAYSESFQKLLDSLW